MLSTRSPGLDRFAALILLVTLAMSRTGSAAKPLAENDTFSVMTWNLEWLHDDNSSDKQDSFIIGSAR